MSRTRSFLKLILLIGTCFVCSGAYAAGNWAFDELIVIEHADSATGRPQGYWNGTAVSELQTDGIKATSTGTANGQDLYGPTTMSLDAYMECEAQFYWDANATSQGNISGNTGMFHLQTYYDWSCNSYTTGLVSTGVTFNGNSASGAVGWQPNSVLLTAGSSGVNASYGFSLGTNASSYNAGSTASSSVYAHGEYTLDTDYLASF